MNRLQLSSRRDRSGLLLTMTRWGLATLLSVLPGLAQAQWTQVGSDLYYNSGNVGVGITTPGAKLHIAGGELRLEVPAGASRYFRAIEGTTSTLIGEFNSPTAAGAWGDTPSRAGLSYFYNATSGATLALATESGPIKFSTNGGVTSAMHIANSGNVGIGTTSPLRTLDVVGALRILSSLTDSNTGTPPFEVRGAWMSIGDLSPDQTFPNGLGIKFHDWGVAHASIKYLPAASLMTFCQSSSNAVLTCDAGAETLALNLASRNVGIGTTSPSEKLHVVGNLTVTGNIAAKYQDVAEWVPAARPLAAGTVVVLDREAPNQVRPSSRPYDTTVAGVVSAQPGLLLGEAGDHKVKVATTGRVKVKAQATRGPIQVGDLLVTSDVEGLAMRSEPIDLHGRRFHQPGTVLGKALEPLADGEGEILVLLTLQ